MICPDCDHTVKTQNLYCDSCGCRLFKSRLRIVFENGTNQTRHLFLRDYRIGRGPENDILLTDPSVSRRHAEIKYANGEFRIEDVSSKNGSLLNDSGFANSHLKHHDRIQLGNVLLHYYDAEAPGRERCRPGEETAFYRTEYMKLVEDRLVCFGARETILGTLELMMSLATASHARLYQTNDSGGLTFSLGRKLEDSESVPGDLSPGESDLLQAVVASAGPQFVPDSVAVAQARATAIFTATWTRAAIPLVKSTRNGSKSSGLTGVCYLSRPAAADISEGKEELFLRLVQQLAFAVENEKLERRALEHKQITEELQRARDVQLKLYSVDDERLQQFDIKTIASPCRSISGDYFDVIPISNDRVVFAIGDICGKGVPAALVSSSVQAAIRSQTRYSVSLRQILDNLNRLLMKSTAESTFVTLFIAVLDLSSNQMQYLNAGHPPPFMISGKSGLRKLGSTNPPLGVVDQKYGRTRKVRFRTSDALVMYTDGVIESQNGDKHIFGTERLIKLLKTASAREPSNLSRHLVKSVQKGVSRFVNGAGQSDDLTLVVARRLPA